MAYRCVQHQWGNDDATNHSTGQCPYCELTRLYKKNKDMVALLRVWSDGAMYDRRGRVSVKYINAIRALIGEEK